MKRMISSASNDTQPPPGAASTGRRSPTAGCSRQNASSKSFYRRIFHRHLQRRRLAFLVLAEINRLVRERDFNVQLIELFLHPTIELAANAPLLDGLVHRARLDHDGRIAERT